MKTVESINDIRMFLKEERRKGKTIGFVPTMGFLHNGHESLLIEARKNNDIVVLSIYVNPTQFDPNEDLDKYPRDIESDMEIAKKNGVDYIFYPTNEIMYPKEYNTYINVKEITEIMCGNTRKNHFQGVITVVAKLFNIINPDTSYFGQKDAQQAIIIKKMVKDLNMDINIIICPIIREYDGLAMSSRNTYLKKDERQIAPFLYKALLYGKELVLDNKNNIDDIKNKIISILSAYSKISIEYIEIRDGNDLSIIKNEWNSLLIAGAIKIGKTRLIDNILINR